MKINLSAFDQLLKRKNLTYDWSTECNFTINKASGQYSTYVILDTKFKEPLELQTSTFYFKTNYVVKYVGKGVWTDTFDSLRNKRCLQHKNDLYSDCLLEPGRYKLFFISTTLSEDLAFYFEAELIEQLLNQGYTLTERKARNITVDKYQLWNKCKGHGNNT